MSPLTALAGRAERAPSPVVAWVRATEWPSHARTTPSIVRETVPADVPALAALLTSGDDPQQTNAALALAYGAGGDGATAALVLGALRAREAEPALVRAAGEQYGIGGPARVSLRWMRQGAWNVDALPAASDEERIIAAAFRNGMSLTDRDTMFNDEERGGAWMRDGDAWRFRAGARATDGSQLRFTVAFNTARTRAILGVDVTVPHFCAFGDNYLLTREADGWRIRSVSLGWIS